MQTYESTRLSKVVLFIGGIGALLIGAWSMEAFIRDGEMVSILTLSIPSILFGLYALTAWARSKVVLTDEYVEMTEVRTRKVYFNDVISFELYDNFAKLAARKSRIWLYRGNVRGWEELVTEIMRRVDREKCRVKYNRERL